MSNRRFVGPSSDGRWQVKKPGSDRASSTHDTQTAAIDRARQILSNTGGGELTIQNRKGVIRDSDTVAPRKQYQSTSRYQVVARATPTEIYAMSFDLLPVVLYAILLASFVAANWLQPRPSMRTTETKRR